MDTLGVYYVCVAIARACLVHVEEYCYIMFSDRESHSADFSYCILLRCSVKY